MNRFDTARQGQDTVTRLSRLLALGFAFISVATAYADSIDFKTRLGIGLIYPSVTITRHIFEGDPPADYQVQLERSRVNAEPEPTYKKFPTPFSWELGYGFMRITDPNGVAAPLGPENHHAYRVGLRWEHSTFVTSGVKMRFYYTPVEETQGGELEFELGSIEIMRLLEDVPRPRTDENPYPALFLGAAVAMGKHVDSTNSRVTATLLSREVRLWFYYLPSSATTIRFITRMFLYPGGGLQPFLNELTRSGPRLAYPYPSLGDEGNLWISGFPTLVFRLGGTHRTSGPWAFDWGVQSSTFSLSVGNRFGAHASIHRALNRWWTLGVGVDYVTGPTFLGASTLFLSREI